MENIAVALTAYIGDRGCLPAISTDTALQDVLVPGYVRYTSVFECPALSSSGGTAPDSLYRRYRFNMALAGRPLNSAKQGELVLYEPWGAKEHRLKWFFCIYVKDGMLEVGMTEKPIRPPQLYPTK